MSDQLGRLATAQRFVRAARDDLGAGGQLPARWPNVARELDGLDVDELRALVIALAVLSAVAAAADPLSVGRGPLRAV